MKKIFLLAMLLCFGLSVVLTGCGADIYRYTDANAYSVGGATLAGIRSVEIEWPCGEVQISPSDVSELTLAEQGDGTLTEAQRLRYLVKDGTLYVRYAANGTRLDFDKRLTVVLPKGVLDNVKIEAISANVSASNVLCDALKVENVSGNVQLLDVETNTIEVEMTSGRLQLWYIDSKNVDIETVSGSVIYTGTVLPKDLDIETVSGDVIVSFPSNTSLTLTAKTVSGKVTNQLTQGNQCFLDVETVSGNISVLALEKTQTLR